MNSLVLLKPDAFERKLVGPLLGTLEDLFVLERIEMRMMESNLCDEHYIEHVNKDFYPELKAFMCSGPVLAIAVGGDTAMIRGSANYIRKLHRIDTDPLSRNLIHSSANDSWAQRELELWFPSVPERKLIFALKDAMENAARLIMGDDFDSTQ